MTTTDLANAIAAQALYQMSRARGCWTVSRQWVWQNPATWGTALSWRVEG